MLTWVLKKIGIAILLLICGFLVCVLGANYFSVFPTNDSQVYRAILAAVFLGVAVFLRWKRIFMSYSHIAFAFFVATLAFSLTSGAVGTTGSLLKSLGLTASMPEFIALAKVIEMLVVVTAILVAARLWGFSLGALYLKRGRLGMSLFIGTAMMTINTATGIVTGAVMGQMGEVLLARLPWALLFALANGLMEELWFRGLFLRPFAAVIGMPGAIVVTSIVFTVMHAAATYMNPVEAILFQMIIFPMALLFGYLMHKSDTLWGSALFHAGSDVFLYYLKLG